MIIGPFAVAIVFWLFIAAVSITPIITEYKIKRAAMEAVRTAIERGQPLTPELVEKLTAGTSRPVKPENLMIGGIIVTAAGVGVAGMGFALHFIAPAATPPVLGGAGVAVCVGIGLMVSAKLLKKQRQQEEAQGQDL